MNDFPLEREVTTHFDQRGCIHVTMDLYKYAHKIAPWCPSSIIGDSFLLAVAAREIDMRASPYDLSAFGFEPICIEHAEGRAEYVRLQRDLSERSRPIREALLGMYRYLYQTLTFADPMVYLDDAAS